MAGKGGGLKSMEFQGQQVGGGEVQSIFEFLKVRGI